MKDKIYNYASVSHRDKKYGKGYKIDFMILIRDQKEYPFINIYQFHNHTNEHKHFIITIDGNLEIAHSKYEKNWNEHKKTQNDVLFKRFLTMSPRQINDLKEYMHKILDEIEMPEKQRNSIDECIIKYKQYLFLLKTAIEKYTLNKGIWVDFKTLFTILNSKSDVLLKSDMNLIKMGIINEGKHNNRST